MLVSMKFVGVDALSPTTKRIIEDVKNVQKQARSMLSGGGNGPNMFDSMSKSLKNLSGQIDLVHKKMKDMQSEGFHDVLTGGATVAPLIATAKKAGEIQMQGIQLGGIYGLSQTSAELAAMKKNAQELSNLTLFSQKDIMGIQLQMAHAQITKETMKAVLPEASYLAEVEVGMGKSSSADSSAYNFARMAEDARITGDQGKLAKFADSMYRVINVTHASSESLGETFKYGMPVVKNLGWDENDMLQASALAAINGLEGSMAGTHIKDFAQRLSPVKALTSNNQKVLASMEATGLIDGVTKVTSEGGKPKITGYAGAALLKDKDHIKSYADMVGILTEKHDEFIKTGRGELEWAAHMNRIFGEQGQDFAIISSHKSAFDKLNNSIVGQKDLHTQINEIRDSFIGQTHILGSKLENLGTSIGNQLLPEVTSLAKEMQPLVSGASDWVNSHHDEVVMAGRVVGAFGGVMLALGATKLAVGTFGSLLTGPLKTGLSSLAELLQVLGAKKTAETIKQALPAKAIQANIVNVYGKVVNGGGGSGVPGGGDSVLLDNGKPTIAGESPGKPTGKWKGALSAGGKVLKGAGGRAAGALPIALTMGAWDVMTAPEGQKVETAVKSSGGVIGGWAGAEAGAAMGAAIGSVVPGLGTAIGAVLGGIIGGVAGGYLGSSLSDAAMKAINKAKTDMVTAFSDKDKYPALNVFPKLDTSRYLTKEQAATQAIQSKTTNYYDTSTINVTADNPSELLSKIKDSGNTFNISRQQQRLENSE